MHNTESVGTGRQIPEILSTDDLTFDGFSRDFAGYLAANLNHYNPRFGAVGSLLALSYLLRGYAGLSGFRMNMTFCVLAPSTFGKTSFIKILRPYMQQTRMGEGIEVDFNNASFDPLASHFVGDVASASALEHELFENGGTIVLTIDEYHDLMKHEGNDRANHNHKSGIGPWWKEIVTLSDSYFKRESKAGQRKSGEKLSDPVISSPISPTMRGHAPDRTYSCRSSHA